MTRFTSRNLAAFVLAAGTTLGAWTPACLGQTELAKQGGGERMVTMRVNSMPISIKFAGGTIAEYVKAVQAQHKDNSWPVNVILGPGTERITVRPIELNFVSVDTAMDVLRFAAQCEPGELRIDHVSAHEDESPTFSILQKSGDSAQGRQELEVLSIAPLTRPSVDGVTRADLSIKPDIVLSAVELALPPGEETVRLKYHEESQLLILQGSPRATNAVHQVIKTMIDDQRQRLGDAGHAQKEMIEATARVERARVRLATAEQTAAMMRDKLDHTAELVKQGSMSTGELQEHRSAFANADAMVLTARADLQEAEGLAALIRDKAAGAPTTATDELASLRKLVEDQAVQIKALTDELKALRQQKNAK
ncbi:MAG: hypothetical protein IT434_09195 [Phycisphaerales bacterium]|jgi:hypothetical protein|nr:hypothetical protein [Phycisphaerales bacterium]